MKSTIYKGVTLNGDEKRIKQMMPIWDRYQEKGSIEGVVLSLTSNDKTKVGVAAFKHTTIAEQALALCQLQESYDGTILVDAVLLHKWLSGHGLKNAGGYAERLD